MICRPVYCAGTSEAIRFAAEYLMRRGYPVEESCSEDTGYILLDVPSLDDRGNLRSGISLDDFLKQIPSDAAVCGGNLDQQEFLPRNTVDFLKDQFYLAENAYITAECALSLALSRTKQTVRGCPALIIGWGRIGKCLGQLLRSIGARVTVCARKEADRAALQSLGYQAVSFDTLSAGIAQYRMIFNTVPFPVLTGVNIDPCCVAIDLATQQGILSENALHARGLPGKMLPESSGVLIARTFLRYIGREEK